MFHCRVFSITDVGSVRHENQDVVMVARAGPSGLEEESVLLRLSAPTVLCGVADGMGGMPDGDIASSLVGQSFEQCARTMSTDDSDLAQELANLFKDAQERIVAANHGRPTHLRMGSTLTVALVNGTTAWIANVGDSRCYLIRNRKLRCLTKDQSVANLLIRLGHLTPEEALVHPERKVLAQALGHGSRLEIDRVELELQPQDLLMLCSDGLTDLVEEQEIAASVGNGVSDLAQFAGDLVARAKTNGGFDNISVVLIEVSPRDDSS